MGKFLFNTPKKRSKYGSNKTVVDNIPFDSHKEAMRYLELKQKQKGGLISDLSLQPVFTLQEKFTDNEGKKHRAIEYIADFRYKEGLQTIVEDVKGFETKDFKLKEKMFRYKFREYIFRKT